MSHPIMTTPCTWTVQEVSSIPNSARRPLRNPRATSGLSVAVINDRTESVTISKLTAQNQWVVATTVPAQSTSNPISADFAGQCFTASVAVQGGGARTIGGYLATAGKTTWTVVEFPVAVFAPSVGNIPGPYYPLLVKNTLATYVDLYWINFDGTRYFIMTLAAGAQATLASSDHKSSSLGASFAAIQDDTILDIFINENPSNTTWTLATQGQPTASVNLPQGATLTLPNHLFNSIGAGDFTLLFSMMGSDLERPIDVTNASLYGFFVRAVSNTLSFIVSGPTQQQSASVSVSKTLNATQFYQIAATRAGSTLSLYIDGVLVGTVTENSVADLKSLALTIGDSDSFNGNIRNVGLWNTALSQLQIQQTQVSLSGLSAGLLGFWTLNGTFDDSSGRNLTLTATGSYSFQTCATEVYVPNSSNCLYYSASAVEDTSDALEGYTVSRAIAVPAGAAYVVASLWDPTDYAYAYPDGVSVAIQSTSDGVTTQYNTASDTNTLFVRLSPEGGGLYLLVVAAPPAAEWQVTITAQTSEAFNFQFQAVPTGTDVRSTVEAVLSPVLGSNWASSAMDGVANLVAVTAHTSSQDPSDEMLALPIVVPVLVAMLIGTLITNAAAAAALPTAVRCDDRVKDECRDTVVDAFMPAVATSSLLLVDAKGADKATMGLYSYRKRWLYDEVKTSGWRNAYVTLRGAGEATKDDLLTKLKTANLAFVSAGGHGNFNRLCGYTASGNSPWTPILQSSDVESDPSLASGKIFHFLACRTGGTDPSGEGLGLTLVANGAVAFIGYKETVVSDLKYPGIYSGDLAIDRALLAGKTVGEAQQAGITEYSRRIVSATENGAPNDVIAYLKSNLANLVGPLTGSQYGNPNARLTVPSSQRAEAPQDPIQEKAGRAA
jgi:hypothetical protein